MPGETNHYADPGSHWVGNLDVSPSAVNYYPYTDSGSYWADSRQRQVEKHQRQKDLDAQLRRHLEEARLAHVERKKAVPPPPPPPPPPNLVILLCP